MSLIKSKLLKMKEFNQSFSDQVAGHPRNGLRHGRWYVTVEKLESEEDDSWVTYATDADWETKYEFCCMLCHHYFPLIVYFI